MRNLAGKIEQRPAGIARVDLRRRLNQVGVEAVFLRRQFRQRAVDRGFVLSDHADWPELMTAIAGAEAETVYVTHGFSSEVVRWLNENGQHAVELKTKFVGDDADDTPPEEGETDSVE